jgi:hypothetical protein
MENTPKTFKELFANTGIEPTTDENGNTHYHFNAIRKKEHKEEPSEFEITPEFTYGKEVGKTIKIKATINSIETEQETLEEAAERLINKLNLIDSVADNLKKVFFDGAKWQFETMYSDIDEAIWLLKQTTEYEVLESFKGKVRELEQYKNR